MYFLDTNICVFIINGKFPHLLELFATYNRSEIKIPAVVLYELYHGVEKSQRREQNFIKLQMFLSEIEIVSFDDRAAEIAGKIRSDLERRGQIIGNNDLLIAATVLANDGVIVTNNVREFSRIESLFVVDWTSC